MPQDMPKDKSPITTPQVTSRHAHSVVSFLYFADRRHKVGRGDYSQPAPPGYDILHNWRTLQELHNKSWLSMVMVAKKLTLDEMMIKCAMKTQLGRRQPNKPIRDGLQAYAV